MGAFFFVVVVVVCRLVFWSCLGLLFSVAEKKTSFWFTGRAISRSATMNNAFFFLLRPMMNFLAEVNGRVTKKELPEGEETV